MCQSSHLTTMKTGLRSIVVGIFLATVSSAFGAVDNKTETPPPLLQPARLEEGQMIVSQKTVLSAQELEKYRQLEQVAEERTRQQAAGKGMDTSTMVIIGVLAVVVIVAAASGGGGGGY